MLTIDGAQNEGGGQILRTALTLSMCTATPVRIANIRAKRPRPGLMRQHLTALMAAAEVARAEVSGGELGSREVVFRPGAITPGDYTFKVGSAGSTTLVLQTLLPVLLTAAAPSTLQLEGGTHNPMAPPFEFLARAFLPLVTRMGAKVSVALEAAGFYPAGGGRLRAQIDPAPLRHLDLRERGAVLRREVIAMVANLPGAIARRENEAVATVLGWPPESFRIESIPSAAGPGNVVHVIVECDHVTEVFTGFGEKGVLAEEVGRRVAKEALEYLETDVPVGVHLADQLLLPMAIGEGGVFRTLELSGHTKTQMAVIEQFGLARVEAKPAAGGGFVVVVDAAPSS